MVEFPYSLLIVLEDALHQELSWARSSGAEGTVPPERE